MRVDALWVSGGEKNVPIDSWREEFGVVNRSIVSIVYDEKPRVLRIRKPSPHLLESFEIDPTQFCNVKESLLCARAAAGIDPEDAPKAFCAALADSGMIADVDHDSVPFSILVCKIQADLTLSNTAVTSYDERLLHFAFR